MEADGVLTLWQLGTRDDDLLALAVEEEFLFVTNKPPILLDREFVSEWIDSQPVDDY